MDTLPNEYLYEGTLRMHADFYPADVVDKARGFPMKEGDTLVTTYPRAGTTWMQEIVYLLRNKVDIEKANSCPAFLRCPYIEYCLPGSEPFVSAALEAPPPRVIKTHLPAAFMEKQINCPQAKIIVTMRNPKDNLVAFYHLHKNMAQYGNRTFTWDEFFELFKAKRLVYGDIFEWNLSWWAHRRNPNILFVTFEEMKRDIESVIRQVAQHCEITVSGDDVRKIAAHTAFPSMKANPMINFGLLPEFKAGLTDFVRKGEVGESKKYFSMEQEEYMEQLCRSLYHPAGISFLSL